MFKDCVIFKLIFLHNCILQCWFYGISNKICLRISKSVGKVLLIRRNILILGSLNKNCILFFLVYFSMFMIEFIKTNVEKKNFNSKKFYATVQRNVIFKAKFRVSPKYDEGQYFCYFIRGREKRDRTEYCAFRD